MPPLGLPVLPYLPALLRGYLLADATFSGLCGGRCGTRAPADITTPYAVVQAPGGFPADASAGAWVPLAQVNGWCAPGNGATDPEVAAWNIAARAAVLLSRARNVVWAGPNGSPARWSVSRIIDGPLPIRDDSRGEAVPVYGCLVRAELRVKVS